jgi:hypothetical protein
MIPLKMTSNYQPNGWLGLIMGTRMYYSFFAAADTLDEASFQGRVDKVVREIGDRGMGPDKTLSSKPAAAREDAVPPPRDVRAAWAAAPSERVPPAPAPAPAPAPVTPAAATTHQERFTPSIQTAAPARTLPLPLEAQASAGGGGNSRSLSSASTAVAAAGTGAEHGSFSSHFYTKTIVSPRQARDKHRKS